MTDKQDQSNVEQTENKMTSLIRYYYKFHFHFISSCHLSGSPVSQWLVLMGSTLCASMYVCTYVHMTDEAHSRSIVV